MKGMMKAAVIAAIVTMLAVAALPAVDAADVSIEGRTAQFENQSTDALFLIWDFGDGTVLDGRWAHYIGNDSSLTAAQKEKLDDFIELLDENGGDIQNPVHTYEKDGVYKAKITAINPLGWVHNGQTYTALNHIDYSAFDGGVLSDSEDKSVRGTWDTAENTVKVGNPIDYVAIALLVAGVVICIIGLLYHPVILVAGAVIAVVGGLDFFDVIDIAGFFGGLI